MTATGVLSDRQISDMVTDGGIASDVPIVDGQIQPASLDLRLGSKAYRVRASFLAGLGKTVHDKLADFQMHEIELAGGAVLEKGCVYVVPLMERLDLPAGMTAAASAKSSIGRLDLLTRIITDNGIEFDRVPEGYTGPLFAEICPRSFSVVAQPGQMLTQMIFRQGKTLISDDDLMALHRETPIVSGEPVISGGLGFSVDLRPENGDLVGYRAKPHTGVVELAKLAHYDPAEYWEEVRTTQGRIILDPGAFYILVSREAITIPPTHAAEMAPYLAMVGEFRVHYAGFFDPGFGWAEAGGSGSRGVLEVRCHEAPFVLEHGQVVGRLVYEKMTETPQQLYGAGIASNYQGQGLKLSKHFKSAE
ncbi:2'-deoxycytidine 5'-triphosphate deaminase [Thalassobium sp. R2A62]|uniref:2'-deoxycytidine 5'-triphosphate deaminase n=1 Tax=Thalassobium sp. R2A62 TaxID=633131 RepID=UPI0001B1D1ED|nr:2'-deoxycytidine 5'-triphosphate deaminase [Thalassobium sp. R2A62]EET48119.1 2'-deoxycytidine 5'-triphosphate deaminase [Thalassobium sp. R2A62]MDG1340920.1 2'-deoxycytidine 5'-triphosphate deaminase [Paracoccaceae bacterium]